MAVILWMILAGYAANVFALTVFAAYGQFRANCGYVNAIVCLSVLIPFASFVFAFIFAKA